MLFDIERQISYAELQAWQDHIAQVLQPWHGCRVLISLPVSTEAFASYLAAKDVVLAVTCAPKSQEEALLLMERYHCAAALIGTKPSADVTHVKVLPNVWLIATGSPAPGQECPGLSYTTSGTTSQAKLIVIPRERFVEHYNAILDNGWAPSAQDRSFVGMPLWTSLGFTTAWAVYATQGQAVIRAFRTGRDQLHEAFDVCNIVTYGSAMYKLSRAEPVKGKCIQISGPGLDHAEKMALADGFQIPVLMQYGASEVTTISCQTLENWHKPGNGIPQRPYRLLENDVLEVWSARENAWWNTQDIVRVESDGQITPRGRASAASVRTRTGMINLIDVRDELLSSGTVQDCEFILTNQDSTQEIGFVYAGDRSESDLRILLKTFNRDVHFVDWIIRQPAIKRNEIGKIDRAYYVNLKG